MQSRASAELGSRRPDPRFPDGLMAERPDRQTALGTGAYMLSGQPSGGS
jgi:hypothetical protein